MEDSKRKIVVQRRGNRFGLWFFRVSLRAFGLKGAYGLLYFVCAYYLLFDRSAVGAAMAYVTRRFPEQTKIKNLFDVYKLFISQGKTFIDRFYLSSGMGTFDVELNGYAQVEKVISESDKGFVLLTSHVGNWQVVMTFLEKIEKRIHLLMRLEDNVAVKESLGIDAENDMIRIISPEKDFGGVVEMMNALNAGDIVSIMGDRSYGFSSLPVSFLGDEAHFPYGAFSIAAATECPVVVLLSAKTSARHYRIDIASVIYPKYEKGRDKRSQLKVWLGQYAKVLETYLYEYPFQSFLFHDVWKNADSTEDP